MLPHSVACLLRIVLLEGIQNILVLADRKHGSRYGVACGGTGQCFLYPDLQITADRTQERFENSVLCCLRNPEVKSQIVLQVERHVGYEFLHPLNGLFKLFNILLGCFSRCEV